MRLLKISLIAIGLLVLLKIAEIIVGKLSPFSGMFHENLFNSLQLLVLTWLFLSLILVLVLKGRAASAQKIATLSIVFLSLVFELLFGYWLQHPSRIPSFLMPAFKQYYNANYRRIIQVESNCSEFDPQFFYRLRPSVQCNFSNIEFSTLIETNSLGLRDDEVSLASPDVICLGDSYSMGWGVQQQQSFPQRLERLSGLKVLNASMSSFGTVRELRRFQTLDTANCKWIVLQYCDNDIEETKRFVDSNFSLKISSRGNYDSLVKRYQWNRVYYPGKTFLSVDNFLIRGTIKRAIRKPPLNQIENTGVTIVESARLFAETLFSFNIPLDNRKIIILYVNTNDYPDSRFNKDFQLLMQRSPYKEKFGNKVFLLNTSDLLNKSDKFILDDHFKASAHEKIALAIKRIIDQ
ncbi:MAG TPA: hypothetical protein VEV87_08920, partial [Chitinophagaceae bacterium]|nr:hypothetical protein [Chitinophagaceae bacterium]